MMIRDQELLLQKARAVVESYESYSQDDNTIDALASRLLKVGLAIIDLKHCLKEIADPAQGWPIP